MRLNIPGRLAARFLLALVAVLGSAHAFAQSTADLLPVTEAYKLSADAGQPGVIKLHWEIAPDYYLYRGRMKFAAGEGITLGQARLPDGEKHHDEYLGDVETYHHRIDAELPYTAAAGTTRLQVAVQFQGCHEVDPKICYPPHTEHLDLPLPATAITSGNTSPGLGAALSALDGTGSLGKPDAPLPPEQAFHLDALATAPDRLLLRWTMPKGYYLYRDKTRLAVPDVPGLTLQPAWPAGTHHQDDYQGESVIYVDEVEVPVGIAGDLKGHRQLTIQASFQGCQDGGICYPVMTRALTVELPAGPAAGDESVGPLLALLFAFVGGLLLNLMPCVLPVLSLKVVGLLESRQSLASARRHAVFYSTGVLTSFALVGLIAVALHLRWGTQLQHPVFVGSMVYLILAMGLSLSGLVQFGAGLGNVGQSLTNRSDHLGDFFTGVLAVVVASACTTPFMGAALTYALAAPPAIALAIFVMLGLGLALPFLLIGFFPALGRWLPRPGAWMETLKQVLAFPLYLTAAWLAWVLANQRGADAVGLLLVGAVLLAMALWWGERSRHRGTPSKVLAAGLLVVALIPLALIHGLPKPDIADSSTSTDSIAFTPQRLADLRAQDRSVFVDMTADWCVTCKANEHLVLDTDAFRHLLKDTGTVYMKGDWTDVNPTIAAFLQQYHSPGVPLYVVFPKGGGDGKALPTVLTRSIVEQALTEASR